MEIHEVSRLFCRSTYHGVEPGVLRSIYPGKLRAYRHYLEHRDCHMESDCPGRLDNHLIWTFWLRGSDIGSFLKVAGFTA